VGESKWPIPTPLGYALKLDLTLYNYFHPFRSFTVHLTDDHDLSEAESHERFAECSRKRREKTLQAIRQRHEEEEEVRRQKLKSKKKTRETLEAYVTSQGELRVRAIKKDVSAEANGQQTDKTEMNGKALIIIVSYVCIGHALY